MPDILAVLAEPNRRRLLALLSPGERTAGELASQFGVDAPAISQHLGVLAKAGLVAVRRDGRFRYYRLVPEGMAQLRSALDMFWTKELDELVAVRPNRKEPAEMIIDKTVIVPLDPTETFALLTEPDRLRRWHAVAARVDLRAGGAYRFTIIPGHCAVGMFKEIEPGRRIVFTWGWEGDESLLPGASTVTITLEPTDGGTKVRLVHEGLTDEQAESHGLGWDHYLGRLVVVASGDDPGPDEWMSMPDPIDEIVAAEAALSTNLRVLRAVESADLSSATPCAKYNVAEVVEHLLGSLVFLGGAVGVQLTPDPSAPLEAQVADAAERVIEGFRIHGLDAAVGGVGGEMPARLAASILALELLVHAWDVGQATGTAAVVDDGVAGYVLNLAHGVIQPEIRDGDRFGDVVETAAGADNLTRLVAYTGRRP